MSGVAPTDVRVVETNGTPVDWTGVGGSGATADDLNAFSETITYNVDGTIATITRVYSGLGQTSTKTFTYTGADITGISNVVT